MPALKIFVVAASLGGLTPETKRKFGGLRASGIMLAVTGCLSVLGVYALEAPDVVDLIALRVFAYGCWIYGGLGLFYLLKPRAQEGLTMLQLRGLSLDPVWLEGWNIFQRIAWGILGAGLPGVVLAVILGTRFPTAWGGLSLVLSTVGYALGLALTLAVIGSIARKFAKDFARWAALIVILGPFFLSFVREDVVSIVGVFLDGFGVLAGEGPSI